MSDYRTILAFDFGLKRIGVAVGQELTRSAQALTTLNSRNNQPDWDEIQSLIREWQPQLLVLGLPTHMDGSEHAFTDATRDFGAQLKARYNLPLEYMDERLSSVEAEQTLKQRGIKIDGKSSKSHIDQVAAQLILQSWLNQHPTP